MKKLALAFALLLTAATAAQAQRSAAVPDSVKKKFVGTWEGKYFSDHAGENTLKLVIARDTAWKATMDITSDMNLPTSSLASFKVDGNTVTWTQELMGATCESSGVLVAGTLKGEIKCGPGSIGFLLVRK